MIKIFTLRASGLGLISSMRLDGRKDIQSLKSAWSIFATLYPLKRGIIKEVKRTHTNPNTNRTRETSIDDVMGSLIITLN